MFKNLKGKAGFWLVQFMTTQGSSSFHPQCLMNRTVPFTTHIGKGKVHPEL